MSARATFQKSFNIRVSHDTELQKFYVSTMEGEVSLFYKKEGKNVWNFTRTDIPLSTRRHKIAPRVIEYAMETARKMGLQVKADCHVVQSFLARNTYYSSIMA